MAFEIRQYQNILGLRWEGSEFLALHCSNLEVAEISEEIWNYLTPLDLKQGHISLFNYPESQRKGKNPVINSSADSNLAVLDAWDRENTPEVMDQELPSGIQKITLNLTQICNLHCNYCAAGGDGTYGDPVAKISLEKSLPQLRFLISRIPSGGKFHVTFLGGEPLLYSEAMLFLGEYVKEKCLTREVEPLFSIVTNGTLLNDQNIERLARLKCNVTISMDGPPEINDIVRPMKNRVGSPSLTIINGLERLLDFRKRHGQLGQIGLHAVFNELNMDIQNAHAYFSNYPVDFFEFTYAVENQDSNLNQRFLEEIEKAAETAWERGGISELSRISNFAKVFYSLREQIRIRNHCGIGKSFLMIDVRNKIYSCPWEVGNADELLGTGEVLFENKFQKYKKDLIDLNNCSKCWARFICGGGCSYIHKRIQEGSIENAKDILFCERMRFTILLAIKYLKKSETN